MGEVTGLRLGDAPAGVRGSGVRRVSDLSMYYTINLFVYSIIISDLFVFCLFHSDLHLMYPSSIVASFWSRGWLIDWFVCTFWMQILFWHVVFPQVSLRIIMVRLSLCVPGRSLTCPPGTCVVGEGDRGGPLLGNGQQVGVGPVGQTGAARQTGLVLHQTKKKKNLYTEFTSSWLHKLCSGAAQRGLSLTRGALLPSSGDMHDLYCGWNSIDCGLTIGVVLDKRLHVIFTGTPPASQLFPVVYLDTPSGWQLWIVYCKAPWLEGWAKTNRAIITASQGWWMTGHRCKTSSRMSVWKWS